MAPKNIGSPQAILTTSDSNFALYFIILIKSNFNSLNKVYKF